MVISTPTRHIVRGVTLERTPVKNHYYLWELIVPLFSPLMTDLSLNYSHQLEFKDDPGPIYIGAESKQLAQEAAEAFRSIFEARSTRECEIQNFLRMAEGMGKIRSNMMLETAIACGIIGNYDEMRQRLHRILSLKTASPILPLVQEIATEVLMASDAQHGSFGRIVQTWEARNTQTHFPGLLTMHPVLP